MTDPKFANLPGIDLNGPDVYETRDLPEDDQHQAQPEELQSESVDSIAVSATDAFDKFKDRGLYLDGTDFSDHVAKRRTTGYYVPRTEYELLTSGSREPETLSQKLQRLKIEIAEVESSMAEAKKQLTSTTPSSDSGALEQDLTSLQSRLAQLHTAAVCGGDVAEQLADPNNTMFTKLTEQLHRFKHESKAEKKSTNQSGDKSHVTYELYVKPEDVKFKQTQKAAELEQRLQRLEATLGSDSEKIASLTADTSEKSVLGAVSALESKLSLLDSANLDSVEGRLAALNHKINETNKKQTLESEEKQRKVDELYAVVQKWSGYADTLPGLVDRLVALKELHEHALQFSQALTQLDTAQQSLGENVKHHTDMLKQIKENFSTNMDTIKGNIDSLNKRFDSIAKK